MKLVGVDIGGSHISAAEIIQVGNKYNFGYIAEADVDASATDRELIRNWALVIKNVTPADTDYQIGIAMPGPFDYENGISLIKEQGKMKSLLGKSVKNLMADELGISPRQIHFTNDAEAFLAGEVMADSSLAQRRVIGLTLGTGLGSAYFLDGISQDAKLWAAPFRDGLAEDYLGTGWFLKKAKSEFGIEIQGAKDLISGKFETQAAFLFEEFGNTLGEFLQPYLREYRFEKIVLGGKISYSSEMFMPALVDCLATNQCQVPIQIAQLGERAAILGACHTFFTTMKLTS